MLILAKAAMAILLGFILEIVTIISYTTAISEYTALSIDANNERMIL